MYIPSREEKFSKRMLFHLDGRSVKVTAADKISVNNPAIQYNGELTNQNVEQDLQIIRVAEILFTKI